MSLRASAPKPPAAAPSPLRRTSCYHEGYRWAGMDRTEHVRPRSCRTLAHQRGVLEGGGDGELQVSSKGNPHEPRVTLVRPAEPKPTAADKARPSGRAPRRKGMPLVVRLNNRLRHASTSHEVLRIISQHIEGFDFINCATAMSRLGHLSGSSTPCSKKSLCSRYEFEMLLGVIENKMWDFGPQAMANTVWALGRLGHYPDGVFLEMLVERALWCLNGFKPQEMANIVWGLAGMAPASPRCRVPGKFDWGNNANGFLVELLNALGEQATSCLFEFKNKELCSLLWGLGSLDFYHPYFMESMSAHVQANVGSFNPQDTSNTAWSCSALRFYDEMLLDSLAQEVCCSSEAFPDQAIVNTLTSFARLGYLHDDAVRALAEAVSSRPESYSRQQLCNTLWALATLRVLDNRTAQRIIPEIDKRLSGGGDGSTGFKIDCQQLCHAAIMMELDFQGTNAENALGLSRAVLEEALKARRELVLNEASSVGAMQDEIHQILGALQVSHEVNHITTDGLMCVGIAICEGDRKIALETESTYQYAVNGRHMPLGERTARWELLRARGWHVIVVPAYKWNSLKRQWSKVSYLERQLHLSGFFQATEEAAPEA